MSGIRFVHTDHLRLGSPVQGLAHAPEWLRCQARDAVREAVQNVISVARTRKAEFLFVGGRCTESPEFRPGVIQWLKGPLSQLRSRGTAVVMTADDSDEAAALSEICDTVVESGQRLDVDCRKSRIELRAVPVDSTAPSDLTICPSISSQFDHGAQIRCRYLIDPARLCAATGSSSRDIRSPGSPQSLHPDETGQHGCFVVEAHPQTGAIETAFEATDVLRFEQRALTESTLNHARGIPEAIVNASRQIAHQETRTIIVDWKVDQPVDSRLNAAILREDRLLTATRQMMQEGHVGIWPRRVEFCPTTVNVTDRPHSASLAELTSILFPSQSVTRHETALAELALGADFLGRVA